MEQAILQFDPVKYKKTMHGQWEAAAEAWYRWSDTLHQWLRTATDKMLEMAGITTGQRVLDIVVGAGEQCITASEAKIRCKVNFEVTKRV